MTKLEKIFWHISNRLEAELQSLAFSLSGRKGGCLRQRKDPRDKTIDDVIVGGFFGTYEKPLEQFSMDKYDYDQSPFNDCVFASFALAMSNRYKVQFSTRWLVKLAMRETRLNRERMITRDGFSYLRAPLKLAQDYGLLLEQEMPSGTNGMSWAKFSEWTQADDALLATAAKRKIGNYWSVRSDAEAIDILQRHITLTTAGKWGSNDNQPQPPYYYLTGKGYYIGGHAYQCTGHRKFGYDFEVPQTFGSSYGDHGKAWLASLFGPKQYAIYAHEGFTDDQIREIYFLAYDGWIVRTKEDPKCYLITQGEKRHIETEENYAKALEQYKKADHDVLTHALNLLPEGKPYYPDPDV